MDMCTDTQREEAKRKRGVIFKKYAGRLESSEREYKTSSMVIAATDSFF